MSHGKHHHHHSHGHEHSHADHHPQTPTSHGEEVRDFVRRVVPVPVVNWWDRHYEYNTAENCRARLSSVLDSYSSVTCPNSTMRCSHDNVSTVDSVCTVATPSDAHEAALYGELVSCLDREKICNLPMTGAPATADAPCAAQINAYPADLLQRKCPVRAQVSAASVCKHNKMQLTTVSQGKLEYLQPPVDCWLYAPVCNVANSKTEGWVRASGSPKGGRSSSWCAAKKEEQSNVCGAPVFVSWAASAPVGKTTAPPPSAHGSTAARFGRDKNVVECAVTGPSSVSIHQSNYSLTNDASGVLWTSPPALLPRASFPPSSSPRASPLPHSSLRLQYATETQSGLLTATNECLRVSADSKLMASSCDISDVSQRFRMNETLLPAPAPAPAPAPTPAPAPAPAPAPM